MNVRPARDDEYLTVRRILDAAALRYGDLDRREVLVAVDGDRGADDHRGAAEDDPVLGALVLDGAEIEAVAVRRHRRARGVGTALVEAAAGRRSRLAAEFDAHVRPFYASLGFDVERVAETRCRGVLDAEVG